MSAIIKKISIPVIILLLFNLVACGGGGGGADGGGGNTPALLAPVEIEVTAVTGNKVAVSFNTFGQVGNYGAYFGVYYSLTPFSSVANESDFISFENLTLAALPFDITSETTVYFLGASVDENGNRSAPTNASVMATFYPAPVINSAHAQGQLADSGGQVLLYVDFASAGNEIYISDSDFTLETLSTAQLATVTNTTYGGFREYAFSDAGNYAGATSLFVRSLDRDTSGGIVNLSALSDAVTFAPTVFKPAPTITSVSTAGGLVTINFDATNGAQYEVYSYTLRNIPWHVANLTTVISGSSPIIIDCGSQCAYVGLAQVDGDNRSTVAFTELNLVQGVVRPDNIQGVGRDITFSLTPIAANAVTGTYIYYDTQPITDLANAELLATVPRNESSFTHTNVAQFDNEGFAVTHYYSLLPYRISPIDANVSSTGEAQTAEITSSPASFNLAALSGISGKLGFYNGQLTYTGRFTDSSNNIDVFGFIRYDPDLTTASGDVLSANMPYTGFLPQSASSVIYAQILSTGYRIKLYERDAAVTSESIMTILADANMPQQIIEDAANVYVLVDILAGTPSIYRSAKTTTDGSYTIMNAGLSGGELARQKIALGNNLLYYTSGNGIYSLPLDADINAVSPAAPTLVVGTGTDVDNMVDFVIDGNNIYYLTGGVATENTLEAGLYLSAANGNGTRTLTTLATGLTNASGLSFVNNRLFWKMNNKRLYTLAIDAITGIAAIGAVAQSVADDTPVYYYAVEPVADASLGYRVYIGQGQQMLELDSDYIHPVTPIPAIPTISLGTTTGGQVKLTVNNTQGIDYYEIYAGSNLKYANEEATSTGVTINGLTAGTSYTIYVKACNMKGCSDASNFVTAVPTS